jgi:hypothetical protein
VAVVVEGDTRRVIDSPARPEGGPAAAAPEASARGNDAQRVAQVIASTPGDLDSYSGGFASGEVAVITAALVAENAVRGGDYGNAGGDGAGSDTSGEGDGGSDNGTGSDDGNGGSSGDDETDNGGGDGGGIRVCVIGNCLIGLDLNANGSGLDVLAASPAKRPGALAMLLQA